MCNINAILTKENRDFFMPLTVLNEPPVVQYAKNVLRIFPRGILWDHASVITAFPVYVYVYT